MKRECKFAAGNIALKFTFPCFGRGRRRRALENIGCLATKNRLSKKVPSSRHVRMDGTHTGKLSAESVRAAVRRVGGSALNLVPRGIPGGRNFCPAYAGRNGFPLERVALRHAKAAGPWKVLRRLIRIVAGRVRRPGEITGCGR